MLNVFIKEKPEKKTILRLKFKYLTSCQDGSPTWYVQNPGSIPHAI